MVLALLMKQEGREPREAHQDLPMGNISSSPKMMQFILVMNNIKPCMFHVNQNSGIGMLLLLLSLLYGKDQSSLFTLSYYKNTVMTSNYFFKKMFFKKMKNILNLL